MTATFLVLFLTLAAAAGCQSEGAKQAVTEEPTSEGQTGSATVAAGSDRSQAGGATAGKDRPRAESEAAGEGKAGPAGKGSGGKGRAGEARLKVGGKPGTEFSGSCAVGDREEDVSGRVPARYEYELNGRRIECEVRTEDGGSLKVTFTAGGDRVRQKIKGRAVTFRFAYSADGSSSVSTFSKGNVKSFSSSSSVETR